MRLNACPGEWRHSPELICLKGSEATAARADRLYGG